MESVHFKEEDISKNACVSYRIMISLYGLVCLITMILFLRYAVVVLRTYTDANKCLLLFLIQLTIAFVGCIAYSVHEVTVRSLNCMHPPVCNSLAMNWANYVCYLSAIIFNLFNWWFQIKNLNQRISGRLPNTRLSWTVLILLQSCIFTIYIYMVVSGCWSSNTSDDITGVFSITFSLLYIFTGISYILLGYFFLHKLDKVDPEMSVVVKNRILINCLVILIAFLIRGGYVLSRSLGTDYIIEFRDHSLANNTFWYPLFIFTYYVIVSICPVIAQIMMLKFLCEENEIALYQIKDMRRLTESQMSYFLERNDSTDSRGDVLNFTSKNVSASSKY